MKKQTICWACNHVYPNDRDTCPSCESANANMHPERAQEESMRMEDRTFTAIAKHLGYGVEENAHG